MKAGHPYITEEEILKVIGSLPAVLIGNSHQGREVKLLRFGKGKTKVLIWSQMHGNESTGLKSMLSLIQDWVNQSNTSILERLTIVYIPQLNPDGAVLWERRNAQGIDINRDLRSLDTPEARIFQKVLNDEKPDYCLNLHDQRTIFSAGKSGPGSALALCVPTVSEDLKATANITSNRRKVRSLVLQLYNSCKMEENKDWSYFDETYYPTAIGEYAQESGAATLLVESGVRGLDLSRNSSVELTTSFIRGYLELIAKETVSESVELDASYDNPEKWNMPQNVNRLADIVIRRAQFSCDGDNWVTDVSIILKDTVRDGMTVFEPQWHQLGDLRSWRGRVELEGIPIEWSPRRFPYKEGQSIPFWNQIKEFTPWENISV